MITGTVRRYKYPFDYELTPTELDLGTNWITLKLKNIGNETLNTLDIQLHSQDTDNLRIYKTGLFETGHILPSLNPSEEKQLVFKVNAFGSANISIIVKARRAGEYLQFLTWQSGWTGIKLREEKAEIDADEPTQY